MRLERLSEKNFNFFELAFKLYESAFPFNERRDRLEQERVLEKEEYHFDLIFKANKFIGIALYWERNGYIFLEHFATIESERNKGYGAKTLDLLKQKNKTILLEIEPPIDHLTIRRYDFYKRNGFIMNPYYHIQAKYHLEDQDLELKVLSYPKVLSEQEYQDFYQYMLKEITVQKQ